LEKEAIRNVELDWLLEGLAPNYHRISEKKNSKLDFKLFRVHPIF
jgi:hypothetical protein